MPTLDEIIQQIDSLGRSFSLGVRTLLALDTNPVPAEWEHITKVDPELEKRLPLAYPLYLSHTSAVSVGGSRDVTERNTEETFDLINAAGTPAFHEPSEATHVTSTTRDQAEFLAIPEVLNGDNESLVGTLGKGIEHIKEEIAPGMIQEKLPIPLGATVENRLSNFASAWMLSEAVFEAYIIMNLDSAAAREANVTEDNLLTPAGAKQRAMAAEYHLESEVIYLEYSGTFGGEEAADILEAVDDGVTWSRIWYGGGLDDRENAETVLDAGADAVIVGDIFHDVAEEEAKLCQRALDELPPDADRETIREWVDDQVAVEETSAAKYLSTIPAVPDPEERALRYLAAGIDVRKQLQRLAEDLSEPDIEAIQDAIAAETPGEATFADALADDAAREIARRLGESLLAERFDVALEDGFAARHLAVGL